MTNTVTLVYGQSDAVLADTFLSEQHSKELLDWVVEGGKNLRTIYVTHAQGDHFLGLKLLLDKFPNAKAIATAGFEHGTFYRDARLSLVVIQDHNLLWFKKTWLALVLPQSLQLKSSARFRKISLQRVSRHPLWPGRSPRTAFLSCR